MPGSDLVIEKGIPILIPIHAIHHDSRYYYDPELFNPDRFSPEEVKKRPQFTFLPFGIKTFESYHDFLSNLLRN